MCTATVLLIKLFVWWCSRGTLRAEPLLSLFLSGQETEKEALHKSALMFEVGVAPTLGRVIPVYCRQTGFSSACINFYEKPKLSPRKNMAAKLRAGCIPMIFVWPGFETVS